MTGDLKTAILIEGLDDWVPLRDVDLIAQRLHPDLDELGRRESICDAVRQLLENGLAEAGNVTEKSGYIALHESAFEVLQRINDAFLDGDPNMWGYALWLNNTPAGDAFASRAEALAEGP
jgi:hypothetical protein